MMTLDLIAIMKKWIREYRPDRIGDDTFAMNLAVEHVQQDILGALMLSRLAPFIVFQGGTSLRMAYGGERFSEDLDFAIAEAKLADLREADPVVLVEDFSDTLRRELPGRYGWEPDRLRIKPPGDPSAIHGKTGGVAVNCWQISVPMSVERRGPRTRRIRIEIAIVPAHTQELRLLRAPTAGVAVSPQSARLVPVETLDEIVADKVVALAARNSLKFRDAWDLSTYRASDHDAARDLVARKIGDYGLGAVAEFTDRLEARIAAVESDEAAAGFLAEMQRFSTGAPITEVEARWRLAECARQARSISADLRTAPAFEI